MGVLEFVLDIIIFFTVVSIGVAYFAGRAAWRGGKRLLGWAREQKRLPGTPQNPSRAAQDVVVERIDEQSAAAHAAQVNVQRPDYVRLDPDNGDTSGDVSKVMRRYVGDPVVGRYAQGVIDVLDSAEIKHRSLFAELDSTFQRGSISWEKFAAPSHAALDAILCNSALLANRIQTFDTAAYLRLQNTMGTEWRRRVDDISNHSNQTREERWRLFKSTLASFDSILETNEGLLLELDKLLAELVTLTASSPTEDSDYIIEEIRRLVEEAKYYK